MTNAEKYAGLIAQAIDKKGICLMHINDKDDCWPVCDNCAIRRYCADPIKLEAWLLQQAD